MPEIKVIHKRRSVWPWMIGLILVAVALFMVSQAVARADYAGRGATARMVKSHPATVSAVRPAKPAPAAPLAPGAPPAPNAATPRPATEQEEALRLRSRIMA